MINTIDQTTTVEFGKQKGAIAVTVAPHETTLELQQLAKTLNIGEGVNPDDKKELPKVLMEFFTEESVDVVMGALQKIKNTIREQNSQNSQNSLALAC